MFYFTPFHSYASPCSSNTKNPSFNIVRYVYIHSKHSFYIKGSSQASYSEERKNLSDVNFFLLFTLASESILPGQELQIKMSIRGSNILWLACFRQWRKLLKHLDKKLKIQSL